MKFGSRVAKPKLPEHLVKPRVEVKEHQGSQTTKNADAKKRAFSAMRDENGNILSKEERERL